MIDHHALYIKLKRKMIKSDIKKGDIYYASLNPIVGCEQNGTRPVVIVQNDLANKCSPVVLIAPITSKVNSKPKLKTHVYLEKDKKITYDSIVLMEQIRVLDKSRLGSFLCSLNKEKLQEIDKALICSFQIDIASYIDNLIKKEGEKMNETMIYTVQEVAKIIHTSPNYVYKLIEKGYLPAIKLGSIKILKTTLKQFLVENQGKDFTNLDLITRLDLMEENL